MSCESEYPTAEPEAMIKSRGARERGDGRAAISRVSSRIAVP